MSLLDKASLILTPNAVKASKLYSIVPSNGNGDMDVVRATTATRVNSLGLIENVGLNVPRLDYSNGSCPSLLVEPQRTNLVTYSEQFDNASWSKASITVTGDSVVSPSGMQNADTFTTSTYPSTSVSKNNLLSATNHTISCYVKSGSVSTFRLDLVTSGFALGSSCIFNSSVLSTNITNYGATTGSKATITSVGNDWYRCTLTVLTTNAVYFAQLYPAANGSVFIWGAQLEVGSYATSYIPTVATTVTRNADVISKTGISSLIGQTEGTIFVDFSIQGLILSRVFEINNGTEKNNIFLTLQGSNIALAYNNIAYNTNFVIPLKTTTKSIIRYSSTKLSIFINGVEYTTDPSLPIPTFSGFTILGVGNNGLNANRNIQGNVNSLQIYKTALTDQECITLTTL